MESNGTFRMADYFCDGQLLRIANTSTSKYFREGIYSSLLDLILWKGVKFLYREYDEKTYTRYICLKSTMEEFCMRKGVPLVPSVYNQELDYFPTDSWKQMEWFDGKQWNGIDDIENQEIILLSKTNPIETILLFNEQICSQNIVDLYKHSRENSKLQKEYDTVNHKLTRTINSIQELIDKNQKETDNWKIYRIRLLQSPHGIVEPLMKLEEDIRRLTLQKEIYMTLLG